MEFRVPCPKEVMSKYALLQELGSGGFGETQLVRDKKTEKTYVLKKVKKGAKYFQDMTIDVDHPHFIKVKERIFKDDIMYVVMQHMKGGDLYTKVDKQALPNDLAKFYFCQILLAVHHLHDGLEMAHQNLKLRNVLLASSDDYCCVKVSDYGVSTYDPARRNAKLRIAQQYDEKRGGQAVHSYHVDMWCMGLILAQCLTGSVLPEAKLPLLKTSPRSLVCRMMDFTRHTDTQFVFDHKWLQDPEMWKKVKTLHKNCKTKLPLRTTPAVYKSRDEACSYCGRMP